MYKVDKPMTEN